MSDKREEPARSGESCRLYEKKFYLKVIGLFTVISIPGNCDEILMDL